MVWNFCAGRDLLAYVRIEIELAGAACIAEIDARDRAFPRLMDATPRGLFAKILACLDELNGADARPPKAVPASESDPAIVPILAPASRRAKARFAREQREAS